MNPTNNDPKTNIFVERQNKLYNSLANANLDGIIINPGPSLVYMTGLHFHLSERPVLMFFVPGQEPAIVLPELELEKVKYLNYKVKPFPYDEEPSEWNKVFEDAVEFSHLREKHIGVEPRQLRLLEYRLVSDAAPQAQFVSADQVLSQLRIHKDEHEIALMRKAINVAQDALSATLPFVKIGFSERDIASELSLQLLRAGCDSELPFAPIVSSGLNGANPHATPSDRKLMSGDLLVIDWGASYMGYFSDITRTFAIGSIDPEFKKIYRVVLDANEAGRSVTAPGIPADKVDYATRSVIEKSGYGNYFTHRTGHGLGMEAHEHPYIRSGNFELLEPGMTFTIEPGIYLPGRNGVRIEDDIFITQNGNESLTFFPRELRQIA